MSKTRQTKRPALNIPDEQWRTALTKIEPNMILMRGYPLDEIMGRLTFGESIYLLLMGEVPSPGIGKLMEAILVSFIDHGVTPPSTLAARNTATGSRCRIRGSLDLGPWFLVRPWSSVRP